MNRIYFRRHILALLTVALSGFSNANENTYTIGVEDFENILPYSQYTNNTYDGLGRAVLDLFAKKKGYTFKYEAYPVKRANALFFAGKLDFRFPDHPYWVADQKNGINIKYAPMLKFTDGVLVLPKNKGKGINNLKRLGMPAGFTPYQYMDFVKEGKITLYESYKYNELYRHVLSERIDGAYANTRVARYYWSKINDTNDLPVVYDSDLPHSTGYHNISSIKHPEIIDEIDAFLKDANNKAAIDELKRVYKFDREE